MRDLHKNAGFSLIELLVIIAIITILSSVAAIQFNQWNVKNKVESQVKKLATDINEIRIRALTTKLRHNIVLNTSGYVFQSYSTDDLSKCSGKDIPGKTMSSPFKLKRSASVYFAGSCLPIDGDTIEINQQGMLVADPVTVFFEYPGTYASLDCLTIHTVRVNVGKTNGVNCDDK